MNLKFLTIALSMVAAQSGSTDLGASNADQMFEQFEKMPVERRRRFWVRVIFDF